MDRWRGPTGASGRTSPVPLLGAIGLLVAANVLANLVAADYYLLWTTLAVIGLAMLARADGLRPDRWGMGHLTRRAVLAALLLAALTVLVLIAGTQLPGTSAAFADERVSGMTAGEVAFAALVRAPLGTVLLEEVAFRGVLLAMLARRFGPVWAVVGSSVAFGAWHVFAASGLAAGNAAVGSLLGAHPVLATASAVAAAGLAGAFLCWLRMRYDHLVVPMAVHAAANSTAYALAWLVLDA